MPDSTTITRPSPGTLELEPTHTTIGFVSRHFGGLSKVRGYFREYRTDITVADTFEDSSVEVWLEAASVDTNVQMRDDHLRTPDFLDVEQFPQLHFVSTAIRHDGAHNWTVSGDLTIRDVTSPLDLAVEFAGVIADDNFKTQRAGISATAEFNRHDFGITWDMPVGLDGIAVGRKVEDRDRGRSASHAVREPVRVSRRDTVTVSGTSVSDRSDPRAHERQLR